MATIELTPDNFESTINDNEMVLIDFWAPWCGPCKMFGPVFEAMSEKNPDIVFAKVNTEAQPALAGAFNISSIPTLMIFREQTILFAQPGALPAKVLGELIEKVREVDMEEVRAEIEKMKEEESN